MGQCGVRAVKMAMPLVSNDAQFFPAVGCLPGVNLPTPTNGSIPKGDRRLPGQVLPFTGKRSLPLFFEFERRCRVIKRAAGGGRAREC
jgi:hypothetical protein